VGTGTKEDESGTGHDWAAGFHHVNGPLSLSGRFETYEPFISFIFHFFPGRGKPVDTGAQLYDKHAGG
jgi:hypothetical protein